MREILVIGGGIVGLSAAHALRRSGAGRVTVVERDRCGSGSTSRATGGIRCQFANEVNIRLSLRSLEYFRDWKARFGGDAGYRPTGYLFLASDQAQLAGLVRGAAMQRKLGARTQILDPDQVARRLPGVRLDGVVGASLGLDDGLADPGAAVSSLQPACARLGVEIREGTLVTRIVVEAGRVSGVAMADGERLAADVVVLAAGCWSGPLAASAGVDLPVRPHHRQAYRTADRPGLPADTPMTIDLATGTYFHTDGPGLVFGGGDRDSQPGFDDRIRPSDAPRIIELVTRRLPRLAEASLSHIWAGLREMTPDDKAALGWTSVPGLYVAAGFSGHGFMHAPAAGEVVAAHLAGREPDLDVSDLDPNRFAAGVRPETYVF